MVIVSNLKYLFQSGTGTERKRTDSGTRTFKI